MQPGESQTLSGPILGTERPAPRRQPAELGDRLWNAGLAAIGGGVLVVGGLVLAVLGRASSHAFSEFGILSFLSSQDWDPVNGQFGALAFIYGTVVTSVLAIVLALPVSVGLALFLAEMGPPALRRPVSFAVEILAAIPSVVYGLWGIFVLAPLLRSSVEPFLHRWLGHWLPIFSGPPMGLGYFAAGVILAIMILPTIASVSLYVLRTVPANLREGALALGATRWEMIRMAVLPYARPGIVGAALLGLGRALGETMAVAMVIGNAPGIHLGLFNPGYTLPAVLANEFAEATTELHLSALAALGMILFGITVLLNAVARVLLVLTSRRVARVAA